MAPPTPDAGVDQIICLGDPIILLGTLSDPANNTGTWSQDVSGVPVAPQVSYAPNTSSMNPTVTVNQAGVYQFILEEDNTVCGPEWDTVEVIVDHMTLTATAVASTCAGGADGEIHIDAPSANEYSFDGGTTWQADSFAVIFVAGNYNVCARSPLGCWDCVAVDVIDPAPVTISVSNDTTVCENGTAVLSATATGGTIYSFHWDMTPDLGASQLVNPLLNTTYTVYAENEFGCISPNATIDVSMYPPLSGSISDWDTICPGYPTDISAMVAGGIGQPYTFLWSTSETQIGPPSHTINVNPPVTTNYTVTITDGCETTPLVLTTNVRLAPLPVPSIEVLNPVQCEPAEFLIVNTTDPNLSQFTYWLVNDYQQFLNQDTILTDPLMAGSYDVQLIVTSYEGCVDSLTFDDLLMVDPKPVADFRYTPNPVLMFNTEVLFTNYSFNGYSYQWYFEDGFPSQSTQTNVQVQFPDGVTGEYDVMLITTSELNCADTMEHTLVVFPEVLIYVPNSFTPDDDEYNQNWRVYIEGIDMYDFELLIYNRWGELIWESHDVEVGWDGTYNGMNVETGTYTWVIRASEMLNDNKYTWDGHINLLR